MLLEPVNKKWDAAVNLYCGVIAEFFAGLGDVGAGEGNIAGLRGLAVDDGFFANGFFQKFDEATEFHGLGFAEIEDFVAEFFLGAGDDAGESVGDVGVIARGRAVAENREWVCRRG